jgi:hypothetical protein
MRAVIWAIVVVFGIGICTPLFGQQEDARQMLEDLRKIAKLMGVAEELLHHASHGKDLQRDRELMEEIKKLVSGESEEFQRRIMLLVEGLLLRGEAREKEIIELLRELIKKVRQKKGSGSGSGGGQGQGPQRPQKPGSPAQRPYDPARREQPGPLRWSGSDTERWGDLPPKMRETLESSERELDEYPKEYQPELEEFYRNIREMYERR